jgi:8-oxo-dGTP pyrophosphatase MutT (NUDIX family)/GNAT superfamily N-acetyltransferase
MLRPLSLASASEAVRAVEVLYEELAEAHAEANFVEAGDFEDPADFADAVINNLPAIAYALRAGLPVTAWGPIHKNPAEASRVLKAMRQWSEKARSLIAALAAGKITTDGFWEGLVAEYTRQSQNAYMAGRRAIGNLRPLSAANQTQLTSLTAPDVSAMQQQQVLTGAEPVVAAGGGLGAIVASQLQPINFIGSGLPGDPLNEIIPGNALFGSKAAGKAGAANAFTQRVEQYGRNIRSYATRGEMSAFDDIPEEAILVWWELGVADHCVDCIQMADLSPFSLAVLDSNGIAPGSGHTSCGANCACDFMYDAPTEVCGDSLDEIPDENSDMGEAGGEARPFPFVETEDGTRLNVWVQEALSCEMPMNISAFGPGGDFDVLDDADAFDWDEDIALGMEGDLDEMRALRDLLDSEDDLDDEAIGVLEWLTEYLDDAAIAEAKVSRLVYPAADVTYDYVWRETAESLIFDYGATTKGLTTLDAELTVKALSQMAERSAQKGKALLINEDTAGPGMKKWLDALTTHRTGPGAPVPKMTINYNFVPPPMPGVPTIGRLPEVHSLAPHPTSAVGLEHYKPTARDDLGGLTEKHLLIDPDGHEFLVKNFMPEAEEAASSLAADMGLRVAPATHLTGSGSIHGGSIQSIIPEVQGLPTKVRSDTVFSLLSPEQAAEINRQSVLDFIVANNDAHAGQFLVDAEGRIWGIDKGLAYRDMALPEMAGANFWLKAPTGTERGYPGVFFGEAVRHPEVSHVLDLVTPLNLEEALARVDAFGIDEIVKRSAGALDSVIGVNAAGAEAVLRARVASVRRTYEDVYRDVVARMGDNAPPNWKAWLVDHPVAHKTYDSEWERLRYLVDEENVVIRPTGEAITGINAAFNPHFGAAFTDEQMAALDGAWILHNHPTTGGVNLPFSIVDLVSPGKYGYAVSDVVTPSGITFRITAGPKGWPSEDVALAISKSVTQNQKMTDTAVDVYQHTIDQLQADGWLKFERFDGPAPSPFAAAPGLAPYEAERVRIATLDYESVVVKTADGKVLTQAGEAGQAEMSDAMKSQLKGSTVLHNHPSKWDKSFSPPDIRMALTNDLGAIEVVNRSGTTYRAVAGAKGWPDGATVKRVYEDTAERLQVELDAQHLSGAAWDAAYSDMKHAEYDAAMRQLEKDGWVKYTVTKVDLAPPPVAVAATAPVPASWTANAPGKKFSTVAPPGSVVDVAFVPAASVEDALARLDALHPNLKYPTAKTLTGASLDQLNAVLSASESMNRMGADLGLVRTLGDGVAAKEMGVAFGSRYGKTVNHVNVFFRQGADYSVAPSMQGLAGTVRHEYGHVLFDHMGAGDMAKLTDVRTKFFKPGDTTKHLGEYAKSDNTEWWSEYWRVLTDPGYVKGTLPGDDAFWKVLGDAHVVAGPVPGMAAIAAPRAEIAAAIERVTATKAKAAVGVGQWDDLTSEVAAPLWKGPAGGVFWTRKSPTTAMVGAYDAQGQLGGVLWVVTAPNSKEVKNVWAVAVRPDAERQGIATRLYDHANDSGFDIARGMGTTEMSPEGKAFALSWLNRQAKKEAVAPVAKVTKVKEPPAPLFSKGPPIEAPDAALGFKPADPQQYLVGDSALPVNAPLASWSGVVPPEPPLPTQVLKPSKAEVDEAHKAAQAAYKTWHDIASGKVDVAFSMTAADRTAAENAGLVYREVNGTRLIGRNQKALDDAEKWLGKPDHAANTDDFWKEVLGYKAEDLAVIDRYEELRTGKRLTAGVVMVEPDGRVWVLQPRNEFAGYQNTWIKGGVDPGEATAAAAVREMREEAGFSVEIDSFLGDYMNTDKTGIARMYIGHRTGGGPMGAHIKETYRVRLLTKDEAQKELTRFKKPDARDQTILADAFARIEGKPSPSYYVVAKDEAEEFAEKIGGGRPMLHPTDAGVATAGPQVSARASRGAHPAGDDFAATPRQAQPPPSSAFAYDAGFVDDVAKKKVETPPSPSFEFATTKYTLPDGQVQPMYWKEEATGAFTVPAAAVAPPEVPLAAVYSGKGVPAATKYGTTAVLADGKPVPLKTMTLYHTTTSKNAEQILANGFDLSYITNPNYLQDYAISTATTENAARKWFLGPDEKVLGKRKGDQLVVLQIKVKVRALPNPSDHINWEPPWLSGIYAGPGGKKAASAAYTSAVVHHGFDALDNGSVQYLYNLDAITSVRAVGPEAEALIKAAGGIAPEVKQVLSTPVIAEQIVTPPLAPKGWASHDAMLADLTVRYPAADFALLTEMPLESASRLMADVDRVFGTYGAPPTFRGLKWDAKPFTTVIAEVKRDVPGVPGSSIYLPKDLWSSPAKLQAAFKANTTGEAGWAVMSKAATLDEWVGATLVHELGHEYMGLSLKARIGGKGSPISLKIDAWFADYLKTYKTNPLTKYGAKNPHEAWSEAFTAAVGPVKVDDPRINELRSILAAEYPPVTVVPKAPVTQPFTDVAWPKAGDLKPINPGSQYKQVRRAYRDPKSSEVYLLTDIEGAHAVDAVPSEAAAAVLRHVGVATPEVHEVTTPLWAGINPHLGDYDTRKTFAQRFIPDAKDLNELGKGAGEAQELSAIKALTPSQTRDVTHAEIGNWLIAEGDPNFSNFVVAADGKVWSIDHAMALSTPDTAIHAALEGSESTPLGALAIKVPKKLLADNHPDDIGALIRAIDAMDDKALAALAGKADKQAIAGLKARRDVAVNEWSAWFGERVAAAGDAAPADWKAWKAAGATFGAPPAAAVPAPVKPGLDDALARVSAQNQFVPPDTALPWDMLTGPNSVMPNSGQVFVPLTGTPGTLGEGNGVLGHYFVLYGPDGKAAAVAVTDSFTPEDFHIVTELRTRPDLVGKGYATKLYDAIQDTTPYNLYPAVAKDNTKAGHDFVAAWLKHRQALEAAPTTPVIAPTKRLFWANSKKQVADPHQRFNLHVAQLRELLGKMEADPAIGALRVNEALLDQVPQLRELLISAGAKKGGGTTELLANDAHALYQSLIHNVAVPDVVPLIPTAPLIPIVKESSTAGGWQLGAVNGLLDTASTLAASITASPAGLHVTEWSVAGKTITTGWTQKADASVWVSGFTTAVQPADLPDLIAANLLQVAHVIETNPDLALAQSVVLTHSLFASGQQSAALDPLFAALKVKMGSTGEMIVARDDLLAFAAKAKSDLATAGMDGGAALKVDWGIPKPQPTSTVTDLSSAYGWDPQKVAGLYTSGEAKQVSAGVTYQTLVWTDPGGAKFKAAWRLDDENNLVWTEMKLFAPGQPSATATATRHLHYMGDLLDLNPTVKGIRLDTATFKPGADITAMLKNAGAVVEPSGALRLTREQALALRDDIAKALPVPGSTIYVGPLPDAMGFDAGAVKTLFDDIYISPAATGAIKTHIGPASYTVRIEGTTGTSVLRLEDIEWGTHVPSAEERVTSALAAVRYLADQSGFDAVWFEARLPSDVRDLLLAKGGQWKAERVAISKADIEALAPQILPTPAAAAKAGAMVPDTTPGFSGANVADGLGSIDAGAVANLKSLLGTVVDTKSTSSKGTLTVSAYQGNGVVIWRRLGNTLEVHTIDSATDNGALAHLLRMAAVMDEAPKVDGLRFATTASPSGLITGLLKSAGAKEYAGGLKLSREQTLALRDQILHTANAAEAKGATAVEAFVPTFLPTYGVSADALAQYSLTAIPQKQGFVKMVYPDTANGAVRVRFLSEQLVWTKLTADAVGSPEVEVAFAYLRDMAQDLVTHPKITSVRFDNWEDLPAVVRQALNEFGVDAGARTMTRAKALDLAAAIDGDVKGALGLGDNLAAAVPSAPPTAVTPSLNDVVGTQASAVNAVAVEPHWSSWSNATDKGGSVWVGPDQNMVIYDEGATAADAITIVASNAGTTGPEYLAALQAFAAKAEVKSVYIDQAALKGADGKAIWGALKAGGATESGGQLFLDKQALLNLADAISKDLPLAPNALLAAPVTKSKKTLPALFGTTNHKATAVGLTADIIPGTFNGGWIVQLPSGSMKYGFGAQGLTVSEFGALTPEDYLAGIYCAVDKAVNGSYLGSKVAYLNVDKVAAQQAGLDGVLKSLGAVEKELMPAGTNVFDTYLSLTAAQAKTLKEAIEKDLVIKRIPAGVPLPPPTAADLGETFAAQFEADIGTITGLPITAADLAVGVGHGTTGSLNGTKFGWAFANNDTYLDITVGWGTEESMFDATAAALWNLHHKVGAGQLGDLKTVVIQFVDEAHAAKAKALLDALGASKTGTASYKVGTGEITALGKALDGNIPLSPALGGSAVSAAPKVQPVLADVLGPGTGDVTYWGNMVAEPHTTSGPIDGTFGQYVKDTEWQDGHVKWSLDTNPTTAEGNLLPPQIYVESIGGATTALDDITEKQMAVAMYKQWATLLDTQQYADVESLVLGVMVHGPLVDVAYAFGGTQVGNVVTLTAAQVKAIGKAIDEQILLVPGGVGAVASAAGKHPAGWTDEAMASWSGLKIGGTEMVAAPGIGAKMGVDISFYGHVDAAGVHAAGTPMTIVKWSHPTLHGVPPWQGEALAWSSFDNALSLSLVGDDLVGGIGKTFETMLVSAQADNLPLIVSSDVLDVATDLKAWLVSQGVEVDIPALGGVPGQWAFIDQSHAAGLLTTLHPNPNPVGFVAPAVKPRIGLDYDPVAVDKIILTAGTPESVGGTYVKAYGPDPYNPFGDITYSVTADQMTIKGLTTTSDAATCAALSDLANFAQSVNMKFKVHSAVWDDISGGGKGVKAVLKKAGGTEAPGGASITVDPAAFLAALKGSTAAAAPPPSTFLDPFLLKAQADKAKVVPGVVHAIGYATDTPLAQGFGQWTMPSGLKVKYRTSGTAISIENQSGYGSIGDALAAFVKVGNKVDATPGIGKVTIKGAFLNKANPVIQDMALTSGHMGNLGEVTFTRDEFLSLRAKINADLFGMPAPASVTVPVLTLPGAYDAAALKGVKWSDLTDEYPSNGILSGFQGGKVLWHLQPTPLAVPGLQVGEEVMFIKSVEGAHPLTTVLALVSAMGPDAMEANTHIYLAFTKDLLDKTPGLQKILRPYASAIADDGTLYIVGQNGKDLAIALHGGVPLAGAVTAAPATTKELDLFLSLNAAVLKEWTSKTTLTNGGFATNTAYFGNVTATHKVLIINELEWSPSITAAEKQATILGLGKAADDAGLDLILDDTIIADPVIDALVKGHTKSIAGLNKSTVDTTTIGVLPAPQVVVAATPEPLAAKLGWDTTALHDFDPKPYDPTPWDPAKKGHTITWSDTVNAAAPTFATPAGKVRTKYMDYQARYIYEGLIYGDAYGTAAQRAAAHWKSLQYLGEKSSVAGKPLWVGTDVYTANPKIRQLLETYGAKDKSLKQGAGLELTAAQAKKMADDMASNANVGGNIVAPAAVAAAKTPEQIAKEALDQFSSTHGIGQQTPGSLIHNLVANGAEMDEQVYRLPGKVDPAVKVQWGYSPDGLAIESVEILDSAITVEMKNAILADFAAAATKMNAKFYVTDGALQSLGVADDWGVFAWSDDIVAWHAEDLTKVKGYATGTFKPPKGNDLIAPSLAPPPVPLAPVVVEPPKTSGISDAYGWNKNAAKKMADDMNATQPSVATTEVSLSALTKTFDSKWSNGITVRWAEEMQGDARILRIRNVTPGSPGAQADALVAQLMAHAPTYLADNVAVERVLVNKAALGNTPGVSQMLKDAGWKETKEYWVLGRDKVGAFSTDLAADSAPWMSGTLIPVHVPAGGALPFGVPAVPTPSFIYGYDGGAMKSAYASLVDKEVTATGLQAGAVAHEITVGRTTVTWSVSPSGKTVGITGVTFHPAATDAEKMTDMLAAMQKVAEDAGNRTGVLWVKPDVYNNVPSMAGLLKDVGGTEANYSALGEAIQMTSAQAKDLAVALGSDTMTGLKITTQTSSEYLGFNKDLAKGFFFGTPKDKGRGVLEWTTGSTGAGAKSSTQITRSTDGLRAEIVGVTADESVRTMTVMGQLNWLVENGATDVVISNAVLGQITKLDKWLLSMGATADAGGLRLTDTALFNARKTLMHDALPVPLGGVAMDFSFVDEMIANLPDVIAAAHSEIVGARLAKNTSTFVVNGRSLKSAYSTSSGNIFWSSMDRGAATLNDERAAVVAQVRSFANQIAQNASLRRLDVSMDILRQHPGLRAILKKYGATEVAANADHPAYLTLERGKALKLRSAIEKELGSAGGDTTTFIGQQAALLNWPTTDELTRTAARVGGQQQDKIVYADAAGNQWLFKPSATGAGAEADRAAAELAAMLGLPVPPLRIYTVEVDGKVVSGSLQKMVPNSHTPAKVSDLTPAQQEEMWRHSVLDWAMNNDDAHIENYLIDAEGHLWAIDKTRAYKSFGGSHDVLDTNSLGQGGTEALAPVLFKFWKDARRNPAVLATVHPSTMVKTLRNLRGIDDATFRRLMEPVAALRASESSRYAGNVEKMLDDMIARKRAAADDLANYISKELRTIKANGGTLPKEWDDWLKTGKFNLDATPEDLLKERMVAHDALFGTRADPTSLKNPKFDRVESMMTSGYGSGVRGASATATAGAQVAGPGHAAGGSHYKYEGVRPTLRQTPAGAAINEEWEARNEWLILHALFDTDTSWVSSSAVAKLRRYYNPSTGTIRVIRSTAGYGVDPAANLNGYTRYGFRNLVSSALGDHVVVGGGGGVFLYCDIKPNQFYTSMFGGFSAGESEIAIADLRIDQVIAIRKQSKRLDIDSVATFSGPLIP